MYVSVLCRFRNNAKL